MSAVTAAEVSSGGTEYRLPRYETSGCRETTRAVDRIAESAVAGTGCCPSAAAKVATDVLRLSSGAGGVENANHIR